MARYISSISAAALLIVACSKFTEEAAPPDAGPSGIDSSIASGDGAAGDAAACVDTCNVPYCESWDFAGSECPSDLVKGGDGADASASPRAIVECRSGSLRVLASGTFDATATLSLNAPTMPVTLHAAATATLNNWSGVNGRAVIEVISGETTLGIIKAEAPPREIIYSFCSPSAGGAVCEAQKITVARGTTHRLALDVDKSGKVTFSVDCARVVTLAKSAVLSPDKRIKIRFGADDGNPIEGAFDDVILSVTQ